MFNKVRFLILATVLTSCGSEPTIEYVYSDSGIYEDATLGIFTATLEIQKPETLVDRRAADIARIAAVSIRSIKSVGVTFNIPNFKDEVLLDCARHVELKVVDAPTLEMVCPKEISEPAPVACTRFPEGIIYVQDNGYACNNNYVIGHEIMHSIFGCANYFGNVDHTIPHIWAWSPNNEDPRGWDAQSAEELIRINPLTQCVQ